MAAERKGAIEIFKVAGIQVAIDYSWLIIFALSCGHCPRDISPQSIPAIRPGSLPDLSSASVRKSRKLM